MPHDDAALWRDFLALHPRRCPRCDRDLSTDDPMRCSGCGATLEIAVAPGEAYRGLWIACMVPISLNAGLGGLLIAIKLTHFMSQSRMRLAGGTIEVFLHNWAMLCVPIAIGIFLGRKRLQRIPQVMRSWFMIVLAVVTAICFLWMLVIEVG